MDLDGRGYGEYIGAFPTGAAVRLEPSMDSEHSQHPPAADDPSPHSQARPEPLIPDHELLKPVGRGSYGVAWLARAVTGVYRAVKVVYRDTFEDDKPYEREFRGIQEFEPISIPQIS